jgi:hypothetical protein
METHPGGHAAPDGPFPVATHQGLAVKLDLTAMMPRRHVAAMTGEQGGR